VVTNTQTKKRARRKYYKVQAMNLKQFVRRTRAVRQIFNRFTAIFSALYRSRKISLRRGGTSNV
jgi:hypothetical protein